MAGRRLDCIFTSLAFITLNGISYSATNQSPSILSKWQISHQIPAGICPFYLKLFCISSQSSRDSKVISYHWNIRSHSHFEMDHWCWLMCFIIFSLGFHSWLPGFLTRQTINQTWRPPQLLSDFHGAQNGEKLGGFRCTPVVSLNISCRTQTKE